MLREIGIGDWVQTRPPSRPGHGAVRCCPWLPAGAGRLAGWPHRPWLAIGAWNGGWVGEMSARVCPQDQRGAGLRSEIQKVGGGFPSRYEAPGWAEACADSTAAGARRDPRSEAVCREKAGRRRRGRGALEVARWNVLRRGLDDMGWGWGGGPARIMLARMACATAACGAGGGDYHCAACPSKMVDRLPERGCDAGRGIAHGRSAGGYAGRFWAGVEAPVTGRRCRLLRHGGGRMRLGWGQH